MCLSIKLFDRKKTAEEDIIVYKHILTRDNIIYETPYQNAIICIGETYTSVLRRIFLKNEIDRGLHSFGCLSDCVHDSHNTYRHFIYDGRIRFNRPVYVKCVIPKGSRYYVGRFDGSLSYASDTLTYLELIDLNKFKSDNVTKYRR